MKTNYLFPHRIQWLSGVLFVIAFAALVAMYISGAIDGSTHFMLTTFAIADTGIGQDNVYFGLTKTSLLDEVMVLVVIVSGIVFAFSKEKHEDEMVSSIRLHSLAWATIANYAILLFCYLFIFGFSFFTVLVGAMFSQLVIFIILFRFRMYRFYNTRQDEE